MFSVFFYPLCIARAAIAEVENQKRFLASIAGLSESDRKAVIARRHEEFARMAEERKRIELLEAMKPHTLWSFLGLGKK